MKSYEQTIEKAYTVTVSDDNSAFGASFGREVTEYRSETDLIIEETWEEKELYKSRDARIRALRTVLFWREILPPPCEVKTVIMSSAGQQDFMLLASFPDGAVERLNGRLASLLAMLKDAEQDGRIRELVYSQALLRITKEMRDIAEVLQLIHAREEDDRGWERYVSWLASRAKRRSSKGSLNVVRKISNTNLAYIETPRGVSKSALLTAAHECGGEANGYALGRVFLRTNDKNREIALEWAEEN